jgi:hypothetical protein
MAVRAALAAQFQHTLTPKLVLMTKGKQIN